MRCGIILSSTTIRPSWLVQLLAPQSSREPPGSCRLCSTCGLSCMSGSFQKLLLRNWVCAGLWPRARLPGPGNCFELRHLLRGQRGILLSPCSPCTEKCFPAPRYQGGVSDPQQICQTRKASTHTNATQAFCNAGHLPRELPMLEEHTIQRRRLEPPFLDASLSLLVVSWAHADAEFANP